MDVFLSIIPSRTFVQDLSHFSHIKSTVLPETSSIEARKGFLVKTEIKMSLQTIRIL